MNHTSSGMATVPQRDEKEERPFKRTKQNLGIVEVFAGIGGVAQGFADQGDYEILALTDIDPNARDTFLENFSDFPSSKYVIKDVRELTAEDLIDATDGRLVEGLLGCPPCQGFSAAGKRDPKDERNLLMRDYIRLVGEIRPMFFVLENVPRILHNSEFRKGVRLLSKMFGYNIWAGALNAALYGSPQTRQRAIVIGFDRTLGISPSPPPPTHLGSREVFDYATQSFVVPNEGEGWRALGVYAELKYCSDIGNSPSHLVGYSLNDPSANQRGALPLTTVEDAIGDLPPLDSGERCQQFGIYNHEAWNHNAEFVKRLAAIPEGGNAEASGRSRRYFSQAYGRLHRHGLARTITANFHNPGSGRFTHYRDDRAITVREAARLQGLDDSFIFIKTRKIQERLIGNAFPKDLARVIASHISELLSER